MNNIDDELIKRMFFISFTVLLLWTNSSLGVEETSRRVRMDIEPITQIGFIGLGNMGLGMAGVIGESGIDVIGYDIVFEEHPEAMDAFEEIGTPATTLREMVEKMAEGKKIIWLMVPEILKEGEISPVDECIDEIIELKRNGLLHEGDIIIDGGNSNHLMHKERAERLANEGIILLDAGVSGGTEAATEGRLSIMVGGNYKAYKLCEPIFKALSLEGGYGWMGEAGAGHFVKAVHNAIEYIFFQVLAEGAEILAKYYGWNQEKLAEIMGNFNKEDSIISSWIVELAQGVFEDENFKNVAPWILGGSTGTWTQQDGDRLGVETPLLDTTLQVRIDSREIDIEDYELAAGHFAHSFIALLRNKMGSHYFETLNSPVTEEIRGRELGIGAEELSMQGIKITPESLEEEVLKTIAFGWLMALKEEYEVIARSEYRIDIQGLAKLNKIWKNGSVIRSYLIGLAEKYFYQGKDIQAVFDSIWQEIGLDISVVRHIQEIARILGIPTPALDAAIEAIEGEE